MLQYAIEEFKAPDGNLTALAKHAHAYREMLVSGGYVARKDHVVLSDPENNVVRVGGLICGHDAILKAHSDAKRTTLRDSVAFLESVSSGIAYSDYTYTEDDWYCRHDCWKTLILECNTLLRTSPLICGECRGLVGTYRIITDDHSAKKLWTWDGLYSSIAGCWLYGGPYEAWAEKELSDVHSKLNKMGMEIAGIIGRNNNCTVLYFLHSTTDAPYSCCPRCHGNLDRLPGINNKGYCPKCSIVVCAE